ncbi:hypothetical protein SDC9_49628 [bioreactor metagenome]|uniref:Uncharacterized protein n=1 Tax=bioreactor metagenome TaxID=1076179 RepID=A0A644WHW8_9ZZZZ
MTPGDQHHGKDDDTGGNQHGDGNGLAADAPAEEKGHQWVYEGVGDHPGCPVHLQEPDKSREPDEGPEDHKVGKGGHGLQGDGLQGEPGRFSGGRRQDQEQNPSRGHLHGRGEQARFRHGGLAGVESPHAPVHRGDEDDEHPCRVLPRQGKRVAGLVEDKEDRSAEAEHQSDALGEGGLPGLEEQPVEDDEPERLDGDDEGRHRRWNCLLGPHHGPVAPQEHDGRHLEGGDETRPGGTLLFPEQAPCEQQPPGEEEAHGAAEEGRDGLNGEADGQVGGAPDEIEGRIGRIIGQAGRFFAVHEWTSGMYSIFLPTYYNKSGSCAFSGRVRPVPCGLFKPSPFI